MKLFFDLETIKTSNKLIIDDIAKTITHPKTMKKAETIEAWEKNQKQSAVNDAIEKTVFDGGAGEIITFGFSIDDSDPISLQRSKNMTEAALLTSINDVFKHLKMPPIWVGHNICGFDLRYLWKRFIVNNIKPAIKIPYSAKPWSDMVYDTMFEWAGTGNDKKSMDFVCKALGIKGKDGFDGSMVGEAWGNEEYDKIAEYCRDDVTRTIEIYKRLNGE